MWNVKPIALGVFFSLVIFCGPLVMPVLAGSLDSPAGPSDAGSAMYTLEAIYNRLDAGTEGAKRTGPFTEPSSGPTAGTGHTLDEVMGKAPSVDDTNGAGVADVLADKTFWGLKSGVPWGTKTGTMTNNGAGSTITPGTSDQTVAAGHWSSANTVSGDADLVPGNIKNGVDIFGVTGRLVDGSNATRVPKTGQTGCWNESGSSMDCTNTGQDGEYRLGVLPDVLPSEGLYGSYTVYEWGGVRFTDNLDGTVTDNLTGLIWLKDANCFGNRTWRQALNDSNGLITGSCSLTDGSSAGDWRLPNTNELHSLVYPTQSNPALPVGYPFTDVQSLFYWSSTTYASDRYVAWCVRMGDGFGGLKYKTHEDHYVWPVRSDN